MSQYITRKINGARYEYANKTPLEIRLIIDELDALIVEGKPKELSADERKANGILRRKITNAFNVLVSQRRDRAVREVWKELKAEGWTERMRLTPDQNARLHTMINDRGTELQAAERAEYREHTGRDF